MEPIVNITKYFPFLSEDTCDALKTIMDNATNYYDFVVRLGHKACNEEVSPELAYMAALQLELVLEFNILKELQKKYEDRPEILVWTFPTHGSVEQALNHRRISETLHKALEANPPDWILIDLMRKQASNGRTHTEISEAVKEIGILLDSHEDFGYFEIYRHIGKLRLYANTGEVVKQILEEQRALEIARKLNDVFWVMVITGGLGFILRNHGTNDALEYLEEFNRLSTRLGLPWFMGLARHFMGLTFQVRGEYDMALECQFAHLEINYTDSAPSSSLCSAISGIYCDIGDGTEALNWSKKAFQFTGGTGAVISHHAMACALLHLGMIENAEKHVDKLHKLSLQSANETDQALYLYVRGLYELKSGKPQLAFDSLEQALSAILPLNIQIIINRILISLTNAEIQLASKSNSDDSSGPWMVKLESHAREKEYPGIQMLAALLRAEFFVKQGRIDDAQDVLRNALTILESPTVKTTREKIQNLLDDLIIT